MAIILCLLILKRMTFYLRIAEQPNIWQNLIGPPGHLLLLTTNQKIAHPQEELGRRTSIEMTLTITLSMSFKDQGESSSVRFQLVHLD